jgi:hypothetical protein
MPDLRGLRLPIVVCAPADVPAQYTDDLTGVCAVCGEAVRHRPHVPLGPSLVCLLCFIVSSDLDDVIIITNESLDELVLLAPEPEC